MSPGPLRDLRDFGLNARAVPALETIANHVKAVSRFRHQGRNFCGGLGSRGVNQPLFEMPEVHTPGGSLMGEDVRLVEMEGVNYIGIRERLQENEIGVV